MLSVYHRYRPLLRIIGLGLLLTLAIGPYAYAAATVLRGSAGIDLRVFWEAARAVGHGRSPYDPTGLAHLRLIAQHAPNVPVKDQSWAAYPPVLYLVLVPLGWLPWSVAGTIGITLLAITPFAALRCMGLRDWRCYAAAYGSIPVEHSILMGTISPVLMLGVALLWRGRSTIAVGAATIVAKLFLWPIAIAVVALEGRRRAAAMLATAAFAVLASWAVIGFADITRYPAMLSDLSAAEAHDSFSTTGFAFSVGASPELGTLAGIALGLVVAAVAWRAGARGRRDTCFTLVILAALLMSPIVWTHYLVLLFLPLTARFPRFNALWLVPLGFYIGLPTAPNGHPWAFASSWACIAIILALSLWRRPGEAASAPDPVRYLRHATTSAA